MKTNFSLIGCFIVCLCFSGCKDEEKGITDISVTPAAVTLDIGATAQLTAAIVPADAGNKEIFWVSYDPNVVTVSGNGTEATLTAVAPGTIAVFATDKTGVVVSNEVNITVNSPDYVSLITGNYSGTAEVSGMMSVTIPDAQASLERVREENAIVKFSITATIPGLGPLLIVVEEAAIQEISAGQFSLQGSAMLDMLGVPLILDGKVNASDNTLELTLKDSTGMLIAIAYKANKL
ncbi:MAG: Ig-like domain-containing protein [Tannerellaceae bacterium]|jgi:hypothetical protein|nr:Ig-like domain-containing protein [Tannerellaceae bacterium]